jgi:tRNA(fMet)-specific endonuclease VapC
MTQFILDTDHVTLLQRGPRQVVDRVASFSPEKPFITIVTAEELQRGWLSAIRQAGNGSRLLWAYAGFQASLEFLLDVSILSFEQEALAYFEQLRQKKIRIGTQDQRIASIAVVTKSVLVTRNQHDFEQVPGLVLQDWTRS